jgi:hypothetical protein
MNDDERLGYDPYADLDTLASACIIRLAENAHHDLDVVRERFTEWLFADATDVLFLQDTAAINHYNSM